MDNKMPNPIQAIVQAGNKLDNVAGNQLEADLTGFVTGFEINSRMMGGVGRVYDLKVSFNPERVRGLRDILPLTDKMKALLQSKGVRIDGTDTNATKDEIPHIRLTVIADDMDVLMSMKHILESKGPDKSLLT